MVNDQFYQQEELDLFGDPAPVEDENVTEEQDDQENATEDLSPEEFGFEDDDLNDEPIQKEVKDDYLTKFLKSHNIDREKIQVQNEDGTIEEVSFDDLEDDDKLAILSDSITTEESSITDQEIEDINFLRDHDINLADFVKQQREQAVQEYLEQNSTPQYEVDNMTDDQLFAYDLINRYGEELTDEEIDSELARAKENEELFTKKMNYLRNQYKEQEKASKEAAETQKKQEYETEKRELVNALTSAAMDTTELQGVELEDADRNEVLDFLLKEDAQGRTEFSKLLSDPKAIFKMAWYMKYGDSTFNTTVDYFKNELAKARRAEQPAQKRTIIKKDKPKADPYGLNSVFK